MSESRKLDEAADDPKPMVMNCALCESQVMDALDGALSEKEQAAFDAHLLHCKACSQAVGDAKRGVAWLEMLREVPPEPPAALLERILAETSGAVIHAPAVAGMGLQHANVLPFRRPPVKGWSVRSAMQAMMQPRLAMTAAMAFFSISLTLNLTGIHPTQLRASDLQPSSLKRSFYQANAHVIRYYDNLRVVYELESRVRELQRSGDDDGRTPQASGTEKKDESKPSERQKQPVEQRSPGKSSRGSDLWGNRTDRRVMALLDFEGLHDRQQRNEVVQIQRGVPA